MAADGKELEALLGSINRSAERLQTLWFSFIGLTLYVVITALTTTHMNLLLDEAQVLPIINMKVPLRPFYVIAPIFYVVVHFYVLLMLVLLARSAKVFEDVLRRTIGREGERETFRMRLENTPFLQLLVGARPEREGPTGRFLAAMALITIAVAPIATLLVLQMRFLPYHHFAITWLHRGAVGIDLVLVLLLWRGYRRHWGSLSPWEAIAAWRGRSAWWWLKGPAKAAPRSLGTLLVVWLTLVEGRWAGEPGLDPSNGLDERILAQIGLGKAARGLVPLEPGWRETPMDDLSRFGLRPLVWAGLISDRLDVSGETIAGTDLVNKTERERKSFSEKDHFVATRDFRHRDFTAANFGRADLRGVDLSGGDTILTRADLSEAELKGAHLGKAQMQSADLSSAQMQGADLRSAEMQGANFSFAQMQGADFRAVRMQGANLSSAQMQGANFSFAQMQGADLDSVQMQGANLTSAKMGATNLFLVKFHGSILKDVHFLFARMHGSEVFRSFHDKKIPSNIRIVSINTERNAKQYTSYLFVRGGFPSEIEYDLPVFFRSNEDDLTDAQIDIWRSAATEPVGDDSRKAGIATRFERLKGERAAEDAADAAFWKEAEQASARAFPTEAAYVAHLVEVLETLACDAQGESGKDRRYVAQGILVNRAAEFAAAGFDRSLEHLHALRGDPRSCPGLASIEEADWGRTIETIMGVSMFHRWMRELLDAPRRDSPDASAPPPTP